MSEREPGFFFERFVARVMPFVAVISFFLVLIYAFLTVAQFEITPSDNVEFVQDIRAEVEAKGKDKVVTLDKAHVTDNELKNWIGMAVSESLTFSKDDFSEVIKNVEPYFSSTGFEQFEDYIRSSGIAKSISNGDFDLGVYIENTPIYMNSSVIQGKHKWLYQMPLAISFFPKSAEARAQNSSKFVNRKVTLRLQITRNIVDENPDALQIENWIVTQRR